MGILSLRLATHLQKMVLLLLTVYNDAISYILLPSIPILHYNTSSIFFFAATSHLMLSSHFMLLTLATMMHTNEQSII